MNIFKYILLAFIFSLLSNGVNANKILSFSNKSQESQYQHLIHQFRCLVCDNQSIADSNSPLASDLRKKVYQLTMAGQTEKEIISFFTNRYGDYVLYRPPLNRMTGLLWAGPVMFVIFGLGLYLARGRKFRT